MPETTRLSSDNAPSTLTKTQKEVNQSRFDTNILLNELSQRMKDLEQVSGQMTDAERDYWKARRAKVATKVTDLRATVPAQSQPPTDKSGEQNPSDSAVA